MGRNQLAIFGFKKVVQIIRNVLIKKKNNKHHAKHLKYLNPSKNYKIYPYFAKTLQTPV